MKEMISVKQTAFFCSIMLFSSKLLILPSLLFKANGYAGIFCLALVFLFDFLVLYLFIKIKEKYNNQTFSELLSAFLSKFFVKLIFMILFLFFIIKFIYILQESFHFLKLALYDRATIFVYLCCIIPVVDALAFKGLRALGRSLEVFYYVILTGILLCSVIWISSLSNFGFNIFENNGFLGLIKGVYSYTFWFCDFIFLFIIIDKIKIKNNYGKKFMRYSFFTGAVCFFICFAFYYIYQNVSFFQTDALFALIQFSSRIGYVGKLDILALYPMIFIMFFQCAMFLYCAKECYKSVLNTRNEVQPIIFSNFVIILMYYFYFQNSDNLLSISTDVLSHFGVFVGYVLPLILFVFYMINKNKHDKCVFRKKIIKNYTKLNSDESLQD